MPIEDLTTYTHALLRAKRVPRKVHPPSRTNCHKGQSSVCQIALSSLCLSLPFSPISLTHLGGLYPAGSEGVSEGGQKRPTVGRR